MEVYFHEIVRKILTKCVAVNKTS